MSTSSEAIAIRDLDKSYTGVKALKKVCFSVEKGKVHGLLGPNGAGKSTLMKIVCGLIKASSGRVEIFGQDIENNPGRFKNLVGFLPENPPLYRDMTVGDYLDFVAAIHDVEKKFRKKRVAETMETVGLEEVEKRLIGNLSKGYQQRVGIAQALVYRPEILILDEPTLGLDPASMVEIRKLIESLKGERTILLSTHLLHEVTLSCHDITIINKGEILLSDSLEKVTAAASGRQIITAEVAALEEGLLKILRKIPYVENVQVEETGEKGRKLVFSINEKKDQRAAIGQFLVEKGCELLSLSKQTLPLEEIFLHLTRQEKPE